MKSFHRKNLIGLQSSTLLFLILILATFCLLVQGSVDDRQVIEEVVSNSTFSKKPLRIGILSVDTIEDFLIQKGNHDEKPSLLLHQNEPYTSLFVINKKIYANLNNYTYIHTKIPVDQNLKKMGVEWVKVHLVAQHLRDFDWVCWMDLDTLVIDKYLKLEDLIESYASDPSVDLILEADLFRFSEGEGRGLRTGVFLMRNSRWSFQLLRELRELSDSYSVDGEQAPFLRHLKTLSPSSFDNALAFLLSQEETAGPREASVRRLRRASHVQYAWLQERPKQWLVYFPKVGILHFSGCTVEDEPCLKTFDRALSHLLNVEQLWIYRIAPLVQRVYDFFVLLYLPFALDRLLYIIFYAVQKVFFPPSSSPPLPCFSTLPKVCVQLPMFNETSCCQSIIDYACKLEWPANRLLVQVLDDSTDRLTRELVDQKCEEWKRKGVSIELVRRVNRSGYKAGAMRDALPGLVERGFEYVAIFDADFLPSPNFLLQLMPSLLQEETKKAAFVQARWVYVNAGDNRLTRMQEILLNFHFVCEQQVRFRFGRFFNFNGTAGVWRLAAIEDAGGWHSDTLVEDLDLSLRAFVKGWKGVYVTNCTCLNQIPPGFSGYRTQQKRWTSGPMEMLKKAFKIIYYSEMPLSDKLFCYWFFLRNSVHLVNFLYFLVLLPLMIWVPRVTTYDWAVTYLPLLISATNVVFTPKEWCLIPMFVLFENVMCLLKANSMLSGLFSLDKNWTVTPKFNNKNNIINNKKKKKGGSVDKASKNDSKKGSFELPDWFQFYPAEATMCILLGGMGLGGLLLGQPRIAAFCFLNGVALGVVSTGCIGER